MSPKNQKFKSIIANATFENRDLVKQWFSKKFETHPAAFYCSIDVRDSGEKVAPVDCNLFPAGFNNICEVDRENASSIFRAQIEKMAKTRGIAIPDKILIVPENHTENKFYLENLYFLKSIFENASFDIAFGRYSEDLKTFDLRSASEKHIVEYGITTENGIVKTTNGFTPDWIVLNNDFSSGYPTCFDGVDQPIFPSYKLGWHSRKKSTHFHYYNELATELAGLIGLDPWFLTIESQAVDHVNFKEGAGMDHLIEVCDAMLNRIKAQYETHQIKRKPALFIKNDSGTYGMGIMVIESIDELKTMNTRTKNKMSIGKNKSHIDHVVVQEGVPTKLSTNGQPSEPVIYMMGEELIGGFIRSNKDRGDMDNLNSQGMYFKKLCFKDLADSLEKEAADEHPLLESVYGTVSKLSALAAARELQNLKDIRHGN